MPYTIPYSSPPIFNHTSAYIKKINNLSPKPPHPQQLLSYLLGHNFQSQECQDITSLKHKRQKLESQISYMREKISGIIKSNGNVIALLQVRDQKAVMLQKLLNQRNRIQLKTSLQTYKTKYRFKQYLLKGVKYSIVPDKLTTIKENLRFYRVANIQFKEKTKQMKQQCQKIERHNQILFQQRQVEKSVEGINCEGIRNRTNEVVMRNEKQLQLGQIMMRNDMGESDMWIEKIEQLKRHHLSPEKQSHKLQIYQSAKALQSLSAMKTIIPPNPSHNTTTTNNIYSTRFWSNTLRDQQNKQNTTRTLSQQDTSPNNNHSIYYCRKSQQRVSLLGEDQNSNRSLSRVKSLGSINTTSVGNGQRIYR